jgi:hemerythrin
MPARSPGPLLGKHHELGHDAIDIDHRAMAECWQRAVSCERIEFEFLVARLKRLMRNHFDREAALADEAGGRLCECHQREHRMLLELCDQASILGRRNWRSARSLLRYKLPKLVREHIVSTDQLLVLLINTAGARAP